MSAYADQNAWAGGHATKNIAYQTYSSQFLQILTDMSPFADRHSVAEFQATRIPGARFFDMDAISDKASSLPHMLPSEVTLVIPIMRPYYPLHAFISNKRHLRHGSRPAAHAII